jgi:hypothetical protein
MDDEKTFPEVEQPTAVGKCAGSNSQKTKDPDLLPSQKS